MNKHVPIYDQAAAVAVPIYDPAQVQAYTQEVYANGYICPIEDYVHQSDFSYQQTYIRMRKSHGRYSNNARKYAKTYKKAYLEACTQIQKEEDEEGMYQYPDEDVSDSYGRFKIYNAVQFLKKMKTEQIAFTIIFNNTSTSKEDEFIYNNMEINMMIAQGNSDYAQSCVTLENLKASLKKKFGTNYSNNIYSAKKIVNATNEVNDQAIIMNNFNDYLKKNQIEFNQTILAEANTNLKEAIYVYSEYLLQLFKLILLKRSNTDKVQGMLKEYETHQLKLRDSPDTNQILKTINQDFDDAINYFMAIYKKD